MINAIEAIAQPNMVINTQPAVEIVPAATGFVEQLNQSVSASSQLLSDMATGKTVPTHELMLSLEMARQHLQLAVEVRNKLVDAYQELMRMQM
ncbi:flagellar hook-basal body complex protein FliE [Rheinheimera riviphila]|uniref:Flagellar hook-basal body complex protein FliE n=1 Tax=Rheinheimera riviphila TaxID=1834037 RepID=A0A437QRC6_9GAMM|nr:flagellar hook-basal body complex protein FliE [Rheinheimera riviphila]RVU37055.1 flagellar hook-basal body complex protein FliE [Rheinheimera riviphila]